MRDTEGRLSRLEEELFFQESRLEALNTALTAQQAQLDKVESQLAEAVILLRILREKLEDGGDNALPPHFMPERY